MNNIIYKVKDGLCITDRRGTPLIIRKNLFECEKFLNEEYKKEYDTLVPLILSSLEEDDNENAFKP